MARILNGLKINDLRVGVLELFVLVLGLFMGFQLDRWNEERLRQQNAQVHITQLTKDLHADLEGSRARIEYLLQVRQHGKIALALWEDKVISNALDMVVSLYQASQIWPFFANSGTYEELKSTGNVDLIGDLKMRSKLFLHYNSLKVNLAVVGSETPYRTTVRGVIPFQVQDMIRGPCAYNVPGIVTTERLAESCDIALEERQAKEILEAVRQHPLILQQLHQKLGEDMILMGLYESQIAGTQTLMADLAESAKY